MVTDTAHKGSAKSFLVRLYVTNLPSQSTLPPPHPGDEKFNCRSVLSAKKVENPQEVLGVFLLSRA